MSPGVRCYVLPGATWLDSVLAGARYMLLGARYVARC